MMAQDADERRTPAPAGIVPFVVVGLVGLGLLAWGAYGHWQPGRGRRRRRRTGSPTLVPRVRTVTAERADGPIDLDAARGRCGPSPRRRSRPGRPATSPSGGSISDRASRRGDLLLRIAAPDLDQQLAQAEAQVGQLKAQLAPGAGAGRAGPRQREPRQPDQQPHLDARGAGLGLPAERRHRAGRRALAGGDAGGRRGRREGRDRQHQGAGGRGRSPQGARRLRAGGGALRRRRHDPQRRCRRPRPGRQRRDAAPEHGSGQHAAHHGQRSPERRGRRQARRQGGDHGAADPGTVLRRLRGAQLRRPGLRVLAR